MKAQSHILSPISNQSEHEDKLANDRGTSVAHNIMIPKELEEQINRKLKENQVHTRNL